MVRIGRHVILIAASGVVVASLCLFAAIELHRQSDWAATVAERVQRAKSTELGAGTDPRVTLALNDAEALSARTHTARNRITLLLGIIALAVPALGVAIARAVQRPIAEAIAATQQSTSPDPAADGDIRDIESHLHHMRDELLEGRGRLRQANDELAHFSYRASHDLKAPLTTSKQLADLIVEDIDAGDVEEAAANAGKIARQLNRLESLVVAILELSRADLEPEPPADVDVRALLASIQTQQSRALRASRCELRIDVDPGVPSHVRAYPKRLAMILENLVHNGIVYHEPNREQRFVTVRFVCTEPGYAIEVSDNGVGIPVARQSEMFHMFKRFHARRAPGSGLGLAIVRKHVDHWGGSIHFETSRMGTTFFIELPCPVMAEQPVLS